MTLYSRFDGILFRGLLAWGLLSLVATVSPAAAGVSTACWVAASCLHDIKPNTKEKQQRI